MEIKKVVFQLNRDSASGPNRLIGRVFHVWWDIISRDIVVQ